MSCQLNGFGFMNLMLLIALFEAAGALKCYQCSTTFDKGCYTFNLNSKYLRECNESGGKPACRLISQVQFFTPDSDVSILRECAYLHKGRANCELSEFSNIHYSQSCECLEDGCNHTDTTRISNALLLSAAIWTLVVK